MAETPSGTITQMLSHWQEGPVAQNLVMPIVYREIRALAGGMLAGERTNQINQPTDLVTEAYLRIRSSGPWDNRAHFFGSISRAMRRILVDQARRRNAQKRGGACSIVELDGLNIEFAENLAAACEEHTDILSVDSALERLSATYPRWASIIQMRFFLGLSVTETATALEVSAATVRADWTKASQWLRTFLAEHESSV